MYSGCPFIMLCLGSIGMDSAISESFNGICYVHLGRYGQKFSFMADLPGNGKQHQLILI